MTDNSLVPANEIWYTTIDGECIRWDDIFMVSNTYKEGKGVIVFDEPTSSLTEEEVEHLFEIINMLRDRGVGIIYISHKMAEIKRISDEITIMRDGQWVATKPAAELEMNDIIRLMVGRELTNQFPPKTNEPGEVVLKVENITKTYKTVDDTIYALRDVSFEIETGKILAMISLPDFDPNSALLESNLKQHQ